MEFGCSVCEYTSNKKENIVKHFNKKKSCGVGAKEIIEIPIDITCEYCNKNFSTNKTLKFHITTSCKRKDDALKEENKRLKEELRRVIHAPTSVQTTTNSMYILQEREFLNNGLNIYKVGITAIFHNRMNSYPKGSHVICVIPVNGDPETLCLQHFRTLFIPRTDIGSEYFQGDVNLMVSTLLNYLA